MVKAIAQEALIEVNEFQVKLRSLSEEIYSWLDHLRLTLERLAPELDICIDPSWTLQGFTEKQQ
eukprot:4772826-Amphidinium_carterae.1